MTEQQERRFTWIMGGVMTLLAIYVICQSLPTFVVYAPSASLPKGWYLRDFTTRDIEVGDLIVLGMPEGVWTIETIEGQPARLLKHVAGMPGNRVCWDADGMTVVTARGTVSYPYHAEKIGMRRPDACLTIPMDHLILIGTHPRSFDSRYIGVVDGQLLQFRVKPLWTWEAA